MAESFEGLIVILIEPGHGMADAMLDLASDRSL